MAGPCQVKGRRGKELKRKDSDEPKWPDLHKICGKGVRDEIKRQ